MTSTYGASSSISLASFEALRSEILDPQLQAGFLLGDASRSIFTSSSAMARGDFHPTSCGREASNPFNDHLMLTLRGRNVHVLAPRQ